MKKKRIFLGGLLLIIIFLGGIILGVNVTKDKYLKTSKITNKNNNSLHNLAMMLETEANSEKYEMTTRNEWPTSGYRFNSKLSKCENGGSLSWDYQNKNVVMEGTSSDKCYIYFDKVVTVSDSCSSGDNLADCIKTFGNQGYDKSNIYIHNESLKYGANDNSYRFAGSSDYVNNYVCFGSNEDTCPSDNLYRIIGVFGDQVKLIKADFANSNLLGTEGAYSSETFSASDYSNYKGNLTSINTYFWNNSTNKNTWSESNLNAINLNTNYLNNLGKSWINMIADTTWQVGGNTYANIETSPMYTVYQNEIVSPAESTTYSAKVGLMYVSDYGYAASSKYWTYVGYNSEDSSKDYQASINENWLYSGVNEWTITRTSNYLSITFRVYSDGTVTSHYVYDNYGIRPCFYLKSSINYLGGSGTKDSPIKVGVALSEYIKNQYVTQGDNNLYYHNGTIKSGDIVLDAGDGSYRYAGGDYKVTNKAISAGLNKVVASDSTFTNGIINYYCNGTKKYFNETCDTTKYYTLQYDSSGVHYETYKEALAKAKEDGYLTSDNIKNYVCFGSDEKVCPSDNLYRIIGVFGNQVKLIKSEHSHSSLLGTNGSFSINTSIKYSYLGNSLAYSWYAWNDDTNTNVWSETNLNKINLNTNYLSNIGDEWRNLIDDALWQVGGNSHENILDKTIKDVYTNEIVNSVDNTTYNGKIGLMYASEYGYAALPEYWSLPFLLNGRYDSNYRFSLSDNWLYNGEFEWLITRCSDNDNTVYFVHTMGILAQNEGVNNYRSGVRPTFYLKDSVNYSGGSGTSSDPYRVA